MFNGLINIIYPKVCLFCKDRLKDKPNIDNLVCAACWGKITLNLPPFCHRCGRHLERNHRVKNICYACLKAPPHFDRAFSPCRYEGVLKELIHAFKYKNKDYLGPTLGRLMVSFAKEYNLPIEFTDFILPVPLHKTRLREREFNQAQILSNCIAAEFKKEVVDDLLIRHRPTKIQAELDKEERLLNMKNSFSVSKNREVKGKNILLVDDVLTTGSTASEAAYTLKEAGAGIIFVLALAN